LGEGVFKKGRGNKELRKYNKEGMKKNGGKEKGVGINLHEV